MEQITHPYYPLQMEVDGYKANEWDSVTLISIFAMGCAGIFLVAYRIVTKVHPNVSKKDLWTIMWFILSGCIHLFIEGYYVLNFRSMPDSRYQSENGFVLCMETITAVCWGPLCLALAAMITTRHSLRYPLQAIVSLGQLYGDVLYYGTSLSDHYILDLSYSRPEPLIFWGLFVFLNTFWIIIPSALIWTSLSASKQAFTVLAQQEATQKAAKKSL